jgi:hypothetical protein
MFAQSFQLDDGSVLELAGGNEFQESAEITGAGMVVGDLAMPGAISPGNTESSAGSLTADNLTLSDTSSLMYHLGGASGTVDFATLHVMENAVVAGTLAVALVSDFMPSVDNSFELIVVEGVLSGEFASILLPELDPSLAWDVFYQDHALVLQVTAAITIIPGDFNLDGTVDAGDYTLWRNGLGTKYTPEDYDIWKAHFGESSGNGSAVASHQSVPEPATLLQVLASSVIALGFAFRSLRGGRTSCT